MSRKKVRKIFAKLHLWMGLLTGVVMFIVCITGCLYAFKNEITGLREPWRIVEPQDKPLLMPSLLLDISNRKINNNKPSAITYGEEHDAVVVHYFIPNEGMYSVFVNPYEGSVLKVQYRNSVDFDFFHFIIQGHRNLWLPPEIGRPIVSYSTLIFVATLITGFVLWLPRKWKRKNIKNSFSLKLNKSFDRSNLDLHKILGMYAFFILLLVSFTGLIRGLDWFSNSVYYLTSGGEILKAYTLPISDTVSPSASIEKPLDKLFVQLKTENKSAKEFYFSLPKTQESSFRVSVVFEKHSYYKTNNLFFNQYSLEPLAGTGPYAGKYTEVSNSDKFRRMTLDIHDGRILGMLGRIFVFLASLVGASLPITGLVFWFRRK